MVRRRTRTAIAHARARLPADCGGAGGDPTIPGHGPHRSPAKIHEFK
jgi:hypothetical protein